MSVGDLLERSFAESRRRLYFIFVDILWKFSWLALTSAVLVGLLAWLGAVVAAWPLEASAPSLASPLTAAVLARQIWKAYGREALWIGAAFLLFSTTTGVMLEAYFRAGILTTGSGSFFRRASSHFKIFLISGAAKTIVCVCAAGIVSVIAGLHLWASPVSEWGDAWSELIYPAAVGVAIFLAIWFIAMALESLIRADVIDSLSEDLLTAIGAMGVLALFEVMVVATAILTAYLLFSLATGLAGVVCALIGVGLLVIGLNGLHAYLLIVRFLALGIMGHAGEF